MRFSHLLGCLSFVLLFGCAEDKALPRGQGGGGHSGGQINPDAATDRGDASTPTASAHLCQLFDLRTFSACENVDLTGVDLRINATDSQQADAEGTIAILSEIDEKTTIKIGVNRDDYVDTLYVAQDWLVGDNLILPILNDAFWQTVLSSSVAVATPNEAHAILTITRKQKPISGAQIFGDAGVLYQSDDPLIWQPGGSTGFSGRSLLFNMGIYAKPTVVSVTALLLDGEEVTVSLLVQSGFVSFANVELPPPDA